MLDARLPYVVLCDADLSMPVAHIDRFIEVLDQGSEIAIGSRVLPDSRRYSSPLYRRIMSRTFNLLVRVVVVPGVRDTQCGFKGFKRDVARDLFLASVSMVLALMWRFSFWHEDKAIACLRYQSIGISMPIRVCAPGWMYSKWPLIC